ncbi:maleylpyruvate isomerase family mycothiol-dependent enzyme [Nocardiopsis sp. FIRDI 009]|uniref:maleylpyruvate isomerase family mycothiol-dependent enzyme n=1 Tax=Nocardiopsis sp. FIRDI 009 TaxID=714197 RepID=UPI000E224CF8|nr:maleylpyruvate isomerase family mycothiol-dependent enzyme [Nocardiopsis sp. FIRDI 009]
MTAHAFSPHELTRRVARSHARVTEFCDALGDDRVIGVSALPGWSRGHVIQHLADNARAFERQARHALRGRLIDVYDGGQRGRDLSIERGAARPPARLHAELREAQRALEEIWAALTEEDWRRPVRFRSGTVLDTALARWREAEIHAVDLAAGYRPRDWSRDFALHTLDFLAERAPSGVRLDLRATDDEHARSLGAGRPVRVSGALRDLAAWMAGRATDGELSASTTTLPELGPWPPAVVDR